MIKKLSGRVDEIEDGVIILDVNGVGFEIFVASTKPFETGKVYTLYIFEDIKENEFNLYGFLEKTELKFFSTIIDKIAGVGPKTALSIFKTLSLDEIKKALEEKDYRPFLQVKGLGEKTAKRIVLEIGGELSKFEESEDKLKIVFDTLVNLGFDKDKVREVLKTLDKNKDIEELVKEGIKSLSNAKEH